MKTLIIDTSTNYLYVSFIEDEKEIYSFLEEGKNDHSEKLIKIIAEGLNKNNLAVKDFDKIIVGIGPGSYTGLRVGLTVSKVFAWTLHIPLYTVSSLDVVSSGYLNKKGLYYVTMVCKKKTVYNKLLESNGNQFKQIEKETVDTDEDFKEKIKGKEYQVITQNEYLFDGVNITKMDLTKVEDVHNLTPNYMR